MEKGSVKNQYLATICVNIIALSYGAFCGWPSAAFLVLQSEESPLTNGPISNEEASWIGAIICVGGVIGNFLFGWLSNKMGRKLTLILAAIPMVIAFAMIPFSTSVMHLCMSRFLGGFSGGGAFAVIPIYITEIAEDRVRGSLGSTIVLFCNTGILIAFVYGNYFSYNLSPFLLAIFPAIFMCLFVLLPETPPQLMKMKKHEEAERSLKYFRNVKGEKVSEDLMAEMEKLRGDSNDSKVDDSDDGKVTFADFNNPIAKKAMLIGVVLMGLNQFCGCFAMINYTGTIFEQAGSSLSPNMSAIIVAFIQLVGSYASTMLVEKAGRKILYLVSSIGTGVGLSVLGLYINLSSSGYDCSNFQWVPIGSFSLTIFFATLALLSLPFLVIAEILPPKIRGLGCNICMTVLWIFCFLILKFLPLLTDVLGLHGLMLLFASACFLGAAFIVVFLPETKGRSIEEILAMLK